MWALVRSLSMNVAVAAVPGLVKRSTRMPVGVGAIGDSYTDEYRFYEPDRATALSWVEILALVRGLNFGTFALDDLGPPRHRGFAHNWARSGSTSDDALADGQHLGLAEQIGSGEVDLSYVFLGGNDFIDALDPDYPWTDALEVGRRATANLQTIISTLLDASPASRIVLATVPGMRGLPEIHLGLAEGRFDPHRLDSLSIALRRFNSTLRAIVRREPRVGLTDLEFEARVAEAVFPRFVKVGGRLLDRVVPGNSTNHLFLADGRHMGTIGQGLLAQRFVRSAFVSFGFGIPPLSHLEIVSLADSLAPASSPELATTGPE